MPIKTNRKANLVNLVAAVFGLAATVTYAQDPLSSWNDGPAKQAIVEFVKATTTQGGPQFVAPEARIATFDQDGTLWLEHPMYTQVMYCLERVPDLVKAKANSRTSRLSIQCFNYSMATARRWRSST